MAKKEHTIEDSINEIREVVEHQAELEEKRREADEMPWGDVDVKFSPEPPVGFRNIDTDKITSLEDVKVILKYMHLGLAGDVIADDVAHLLED